MTTPANLTHANILTRVANALRIPETNTTETAKLSALINEVYRDIWIKNDFWFFTKRSVINTEAVYNTGTVSVTAGSTTATLSGAPAAGLGSFARRVLMVTGDTVDNNALYRISAHTAASATLTLDAAFTGATNATASYNLWKDSYSAPADLGKLLKPRRYGRDFGMAPIGPGEMADLKTRDQSVGKPSVYTVEDYQTTGDPTTARQLIVHPFPDQTYRIEFTYKQQLNTEMSTTTQPLIPDEYRQILVYGALARGYPIYLADTERGAFYQGLFNDTLNLMTAAHREYSQDRPAFQPADADRRRSGTRRRIGRVSMGTYFDIWPSEPNWP